MRRTVPAITVLSVGLALTLSGCFANPLEQLTERLVEGGVEQIIEDKTGVDIDIDGTGASLPDGWPGEVPTVDGDVAFSAAIDDTFAAALVVRDAAAAENAYSLLTNAGFTEISSIELGEGASSKAYESGMYTVGVIIGINEDGTAIVQYTVTKVIE
jgi:hypothetical protein